MSIGAISPKWANNSQIIRKHFSITMQKQKSRNCSEKFVKEPKSAIQTKKCNSGLNESSAGRKAGALKNKSSGDRSSVFVAYGEERRGR